MHPWLRPGFRRRRKQWGLRHSGPGPQREPAVAVRTSVSRPGACAAALPSAFRDRRPRNPCRYRQQERRAQHAPPSCRSQLFGRERAVIAVPRHTPGRANCDHPGIDHGPGANGNLQTAGQIAQCRIASSEALHCGGVNHGSTPAAT